MGATPPSSAFYGYAFPFRFLSFRRALLLFLPLLPDSSCPCAFILIFRLASQLIRHRALPPLILSTRALLRHFLLAPSLPISPHWVREYAIVETAPEESEPVIIDEFGFSREDEAEWEDMDP
ncbi:hypothetical protein C8J57DRAFT_1504133 [Mycena rebaudengoi]|nr:hypothetical protein C8J57DRAFT_1504133 [Mycena rebaudengoi]